MIRNLNVEGIQNFKEMQRTLQLYVKADLCDGQKLPPLNNRFYPEEIDIWNHSSRQLHVQS